MRYRDLIARMETKLEIGPIEPWPSKRQDLTALVGLAKIALAAIENGGVVPSEISGEPAPAKMRNIPDDEEH